MSVNVEIVAKFRRERIAFDGDPRVVIADVQLPEPSTPNTSDIKKVNHSLAVKGPADEDEFIRNKSYRFFGQYRNYKNRRTGKTERQFHFRTFVPHIPHDPQGVIDYLTVAGKGNGIGPTKARKIVASVGVELALEVCRNDPDRVADIAGISKPMAQTFADILASQQATENAVIEVDSILSGSHVPRSLTRRLVKLWGNRAAKRIIDDPYCLMQFGGVGFARADALYLKIGKDPKAICRQSLHLWNSIESGHDGHTWIPAESVVRKLQQQFGSDVDYRSAIHHAKNLDDTHYGAVSTVRANGDEVADDGKRLWLATRRNANAEMTIADHIVSSISNPIEYLAWPRASELDDCSPHQREKYAMATVGRIGILGGLPGTGKTRTLGKIIHAALASGRVRHDEIGVCAPTNLAARRLTDSLRDASADTKAKTSHSLLGVATAGMEDGNWAFKHNQENKWPFKMMFFDEQSMEDVRIMASKFRACSPGCHLLFVGDVNQLSPVGNGAPFRDMIRSGLPYGELTEIVRSSGGIVESCKKIRDCQPWVNDCVEGKSNLVITGDRIEADQVQRVRELLMKEAANGLDPIWDCQILVPINRGSAVSRVGMNRLIQGWVNPSKTASGYFRIGDKVICNEKQFLPSVVAVDKNNDDIVTDSAGNVCVDNGEIGRVDSIGEGSMVVEMFRPSRMLRVTLASTSSESGDPSPGCSFDLAYALTIHKFQGSEQKAVIGVLDASYKASMVFDRSCLFTLISRAKSRCWLVGERRTAERFCRIQRINDRRTFLSSRIADGLESEILL
jgi:exodeoxyribonuclease V alpha subunit